MIRKLVYLWVGLGLLALIMVLATPSYEIKDFELEVEKTYPEKPIMLDGLSHYNRENLPENASVKNFSDASKVSELIDDDGNSFRLLVDNITEEQREIVENNWFRYTVRDRESFQNYTVRRVNDSDQTALKFDIELEDRSVTLGDPAVFKYSLSNPTDRVWGVFSGTYSPPFSMQYAKSGDRRILLWRNKYYSDKSTFLPLKSIGLRTLAGQTSTIKPGETVSQKHMIAFDTYGLEAGNYTINETMEYNSGNRREKINYVANFEVVRR